MFRRTFLVLGAGFCLSAPAPALAGDTPLPAAAYAAPGMFEDVALSPSGKQIAMVGQKDSRAILRVYDADDLKAGPKAEYQLGEAPRVRWIRWKTDTWLLVSVGLPDTGLGQAVQQARLMSTRADLKTFLNVWRKPPNGTTVPQYQDQVASFLPGDPGAILMQIDWRTPVYPGLRKLDLRTGETVLLRDRDKRVLDWIVDADGTPRLARGDYTRNEPPYFRVGDDGKLTPFEPKVPEKANFQAIGFDGAPNRLVVLSDHEGGTSGLYIYDLDKDAFGEQLFKDDRYEVSDAVYAPDGRSVIGAAYVTDQSEVVYFDPVYVAKADRARALVGGGAIAVLDATPDGGKMLIGKRENSRLVETWWVDLVGGKAQSLGRFNPVLDAASTGRVFPVAYKARDGLEIPAYVTLPPGYARLQDARGLPFVVMPHGGPQARDTAEYDWWAQFLASRGYGVFQPNYRGSTGYGETFTAAGRGQWGQAIQNDVSDGARWLVSQGYADKNRMCIAGGSFGGYTALVAAYLNADQYKCAVSLAGVADLDQLVAERKLYYGHDFALRTLLGGLLDSPTAMHAYSPADNAARMAMPVLIVQGTADSVVPLRQGQLMSARMKAAGRPYTYLELPLADHGLSREKDRQAFLGAVETFLGSAIGTPSKASP